MVEDTATDCPFLRMGEEPSVTDSVGDVGSWYASKKRKRVEKIIGLFPYEGVQVNTHSVYITSCQPSPHEPRTEAGTNVCKRNLPRGWDRRGKGCLRFHICGGT